MTLFLFDFFADFTCYGYDENGKTTSFEAGEDVAMKTMEAFMAQKKRYIQYN